MCSFSSKSLKTKFKNLAVLLFVSALVLSASVGEAMENGNWSYPGGNNAFPARLTPKGLNILNATSIRHNSELKDNNGDDVPITYDVRAITSSTNFLYNTGEKVLGGYLALYSVVPLLDLRVKTPAGEDSVLGVGDISVGISNAYISKNWQIIPSLEVIMPTAQYDKNDIVSLGFNRFIFEPYVMLNYMSDSGFIVGTKTMLDYSTENHDTDYKSGQELHMDYAIGQRIGACTFGIAGYFYKQITDDKIGSHTVKDSKAQAIGIGPSLVYSSNNIDFTFQYTKDYAVKNKGEGDQLWFKTYIAF